MASPQEMQPTVEDCYSDDSEGGSIPFQGRRSPNAANVSTKRSHPSDLDKEMPPAQQRAPANIDLRSDSGYSSYTTATVSSTNSAQSAPPQRSPPQVPAAAAPAPPQPEAPKARRRPVPTDTTEKTSKSSSRPKPSRTASSASKPPAVVQQQPPERKRRPTVTQESRPERRDRRDSRVEPDGAEPRRTKYDPNAPASAVRRRPDIQPSQSARDVTRPIPQDTRSMHSDPPSYQQAPPSPTHYRQSYYAHGAAVIQPAATRRRPSISTTGRPISYSGEPGPQYHWTQGAPGYPTPPPERGPPLSSSAHYPRGFPMPAMGQMGPPQTPYGVPPGYPPQFYQMPYDDGQRPGMPQRSSSNAARRGPAPPVINQAPREQQYSTRYSQPQSATHPRLPAPLQLNDRPHESDYESESELSEDDDYYVSEPEVDPNDPRTRRALMPPPPPKAPKSKSNTKTKPKTKNGERPPLPHAHTTTTVEKVRSHRHSMSTPPIVVDEDRSSRHRTTKSTNEPSRRQSISRPLPPAHTQTEYPARRGSVYVNDSVKAERRRSAHYGHSARDKEYAEYAAGRKEAERLEAEERARKELKAANRAKRERQAQRQAENEARYEAEQERKREKRNSKVYYQPPAAFDDSDEEYQSDEAVAPVVPEAPVPPRPRRPTDAGGRKAKESLALDYINSQRGTDVPLNDHIHRAAKRASRVPSMPSHSGSSGSDRQSQSNRTALTSSGNNEIRLRVDANAPLSLQFNGDMEGRTMQLIPTEDGMAELVISGSRDNESNYHSSERGSNAGDGQALVRRKQPEEMTEGSMRSHRSRRESRVVRDSYDDRIVEVPRPLRRRANTSSHYYN
ncbi:hypothetical protein BKA58DRAFT_12845 [Alternaria rosae]|uniref:uncharacterized protein n=1 Tax=Alternaria rosae TaxID=1187941 RepID=UPI001E8E3F64|nr:uncharacterized protein BKA58DRAFT_12845 [Alternaria rosae]KAH6882080.1 hypothetical protein BKA58DRAFT_12845 [Alternaria rosae]